MDAAEIARCERVASGLTNYVSEDHLRADLRALIADLEQARKENGKLGRAVDAALSGEEGDHAAIRIENGELRAQRDAAQQSAKDARALLGEADEWLTAPDDKGCDCEQCEKALALRARIEAMLEQKP